MIMKKKNKEKLINHVALVIDDSGSMSHLVFKTRDVVRDQLKNFRQAAESQGQETLVSIFTFGNRTHQIALDLPPRMVGDPNGFINATSGGTALIDATFEAINYLQRIPTKTGDHSFLVYVITDGEENQSRLKSYNDVATLIDGLNDDWTIAAMVPNATAKHYVKNLGVPSDNIDIWDTTSVKGMEDVGATIGTSYGIYASNRSLGVKSSASMFAFKQNITKKEVEKNLQEVDPGTYETLLVRKYDNGKEIKEFVEKWRKLPYRVGSAYYQLTKPEKIQGSKSIAVLQKSTGKLYSGADARNFLGLPNYEVKVKPADYVNFDIFVQSTSTNRHLVGDTQLIVFK